MSLDDMKTVVRVIQIVEEHVGDDPKKQLEFLGKLTAALICVLADELGGEKNLRELVAWFETNFETTLANGWQRTAILRNNPPSE